MERRRKGRHKLKSEAKNNSRERGRARQGERDYNDRLNPSLLMQLSLIENFHSKLWAERVVMELFRRRTGGRTDRTAQIGQMETPPQSGRWKLTCTHTQRERERNKRTHCSVSFGALHVQRNKAGMGEEERKGGWGLAQRRQPGQDEWKQSSVQITSRKTEGIWKFALMRSVAEEEKQQQRERESWTRSRDQKLVQDFITKQTSSRLRLCLLLHLQLSTEAFNLSFILIAVDDDKDNDDDGVGVLWFTCAHHLPASLVLPACLPVYTGEMPLDFN